MADGSLTFDTAIDESGFNKGLDKLGKRAARASGNVADEAVEAAEEVAEAAEEAAERTAEAAEEAARSAEKASKDAGKSAEKAGKNAEETAERASKEIGKSSRQAGEEAEGATKKVQGGIEALSSALAAAGVAMTAKEIAEALYDCTEAAAAFETGIAKVMTIADGSKATMESMKSSIMELSSSIGVDANELSESTYQAISASVDTADAVNVVGEATKLAIGGFTDTATAIDILTTAMNAYGLGTDQVTRLSDVLVTTQNLGKTSVGEVASAMGKVIPLAAAYGMEIENLSSAYAVLTANGIKTDEATTYIKAALNELGDSGSTVGKILKENTGKGFSELTQEGKSLGDVLQVIGDSVGGNAAEFNNLWSSAEAGVGMLSIYNSGAEKFNSVLEQMQGSTGATEAAFGRMTDTTEYAKKRLANATENMKIAIGDKLTPALKKVYEAGAGAFEWATKFVDEHPEVVAAVSALTVALGMLVAGFTGLVIVPKILMVTQKAMTAFSATLAANPFGMIAVALSALTTAVLTFQNVLESQNETSDENAKAVRESREAYEALRKTMDDNAAQSKQNKEAIEDEYGACKVLSDKLYKLADKESKSASDKRQMAAMVDELNSKIPNLNLSLDETTGELNKQKAATDALVDSMKNQALAAAAQDDMTQAAKAKYEAERQLEKAQEEYNGLVKQAIKEENEYKDAVKQTTSEISSSAAMSGSRTTAASKTRIQIEEQRKTLDGLHKACDDASAEFDKASERYAGYQEAASGAADANGELAESSGVQQEALQALQEKYTEFREQLEQDIQNKVSLFDTFDGGEDITVEKMLENLQSQREGLENWKENMATLANEVGTTITPEFYNKILEMGPQAANAVQHMVTTLDQGNGRELLAQMAQDWGGILDLSGAASAGLANTGVAVESGLVGIMNIARVAGVSIPEELSSEIVGGTGDVDAAAGKLGGIFAANIGQIQQMAADAGIQIPSEITAGLEAGGADAAAAVQALAALMQCGTGEMAEIGSKGGGDLAQNTAEGIESGSGEAVGAASDLGKNAGESMQKSEASAIEKNAPKVTSATDGALQQAEETARGHKDAFDDIGYCMAEGLAAGINRGSPIVNKAVNSVLDSAQKEGEKKIEKHSPSHVWRDEIGLNMAEGVAAGLDKGTGLVEGSTRDLAGASLDAAKNELEIHSPSGVFKKEVGKQIVQGIIKGVKKEERKLRKEMESLSGDALEAAKEAAGGSYSEVGSSIMDSITEGMQKRQELATRKAEAIVNKYIDKVSSTGTVRKYEKQAENYEKKAKTARENAQKSGKKGGNKEEEKKYEAQEKRFEKLSKKYKKKAEKYKKKFGEIGSSLVSSLSDGINAEFGKIENDLMNNITKISSECQQAYDELESKRDSMASKMATPVNFYDLDTQLAEVRRYQKGLDSLKGKISDTLMDEILGMDLKEAVNFAEYLNSLTDAELEAYKNKWEELRAQSEGYSEGFFEKQFESLQSDWERKIREALADAESQMKGVGKNICRGLVKGMKSEKELLSKECRKMAKIMINQFKDTLGIHSPSKVMETQVGKFLPPGIAKGFDKALPDAQRRITAGVERAIASLQSGIESLQCIPAMPYGGIPSAPHVTVANSQPVQVQAEIHTTVDLDGRTVGQVVTPYVNQGLAEQQTREERGS
jgi:TP901 family phage tail tape measure protein